MVLTKGKYRGSTVPNKYFLFIGLTLIALGVVVNLASGRVVYGYTILGMGGALKGVYLYQSVKAGLIILGSSIYYLGIGMGLMVISQILKFTDSWSHSIEYILIAGIVFKSIFVIQVVFKTRKKRIETKQVI